MELAQLVVDTVETVLLRVQMVVPVVVALVMLLVAQV
jgi:hypothetical protein